MKNQNQKTDTCNIDGCINVSRHSGGNSAYCSTHQQRLSKYGDANGGMNSRPGESKEFFENCISFDIDDCIEWPFYNRAGYGFLYGDFRYGAKNGITVTRLALINRVGPPPPDKPHALHSCHNPPCFNYRHLRWGTATENMADRINDGTMIYGTAIAQSVLTEDDVKKIRYDSRSYSKIASQYGVDTSTVYSIKNRKSWTWLDDHGEEK